MSLNFFIKKKILSSLIFIIFFIVGLANVKNYGISFDELEYRQQGFIVANYLGKKVVPKLVENLTEERELDYIEIDSYFKGGKNNFKISHTFTAIFEGLFMRNSEKREVYLFRHYLNFLIGFLTIAFTYRISRMKFSRNVSLMISILFMSTPLIISNFNFNPNDIWFMFFITLSVFLSLKLIEDSNSKKYIFLLPIILALSINIRFIGIYILFIFLPFYLFCSNERVTQSKKIKNILIILFLLISITYFLTPQLWDNPIGFINLLFGQIKFKGIEVEIMFLGELIKSSELPWYYLLVWMAISLPILIIIFFLASLLIILQKIFEEKKIKVFETFIFIVFILPLIAFCVFKPNLFNGWRHFYFIFPFILILSAFTLNFFEKNPVLNKLIIIILLINTSSIIIWNIKNNPHQYVYFNLFSKKFAKNFELDYWGVSNLEVLKYLLEKNTNNDQVIVTNLGRSRADFSILMLDKNQRKKIKFSKIDEPGEKEYFINHINSGKNKSYFKNLGYDVIKEFNVDGITINTIYKKITKP